ncbi:hypothetical protein KAW38_04770 [Candidatus Micrarchaeota archaeon]|nr:hypothetical protein [Candidatus Micrarchaeota archaeon]
MKAKHTKAFVSFDALFSIIPLLLMLYHILYLSTIIPSTSEARLESIHLMNKLYSVADYTVNYGAVKKESSLTGTSLYYPNLIESLNELDTDKIKEQMNLKSLSISFEQGEGNCIYRLVLHEEEIKKLYICGE